MKGGKERGKNRKRQISKNLGPISFLCVAQMKDCHRLPLTIIIVVSILPEG